MPARSISWWLTISASAGTSFRVERGEGFILAGEQHGGVVFHGYHDVALRLAQLVGYQPRGGGEQGPLLFTGQFGVGLDAQQGHEGFLVAVFLYGLAGGLEAFLALCVGQVGDFP
jgi:hypothetical protein